MFCVCFYYICMCYIIMLIVSLCVTLYFTFIHYAVRNKPPNPCDPSSLIPPPKHHHSPPLPPPGFTKRAPGSKAPLSSPTAAISCPHGRLIPETAAPATKRTAVPRALFLLLRQIWEQVGGGKGGGGGGERVVVRSRERGRGGKAEG